MNTNNATLFEQLTNSLPESVRADLSEALRRANINNTDDPILELMMILGIFASYYELIPERIREAGEFVEKIALVMQEALDGRLDRLQTSARHVQAAVDQLAGAPQAIVDRFPVAAIGDGITRRLDLHLQDLPLGKLQDELLRLGGRMEALVGSDGHGGIAERVNTGMARLEDAVQQLPLHEILPTQWFRHIITALCSGALVASVIWFTGLLPAKPATAILSPEESRRIELIGGILNFELFASQKMDVTRDQATGVITLNIPEASLVRAERRANGGLTVELTPPKVR